jgi:hypothetical protein
MSFSENWIWREVPGMRLISPKPEPSSVLAGSVGLPLVRHLGQKIIHLSENISFVRDEHVMIRIWQPNDTSRWCTSLKRICLC